MSKDGASIRVVMGADDLIRMNSVLRHRLRNFISGIKTSMSLVSREVEGVVSPDVAEYFPLIARECDSLETLTARMGQVFDVQPAGGVSAVEKVLVKMLGDVKSGIPAADIRVDVAKTVARLHVACDSAVSTALAEIVRNACEAAPRDTVTVQVSAVNDMVNFKVMDGGAGVPADVQDKIFFPFFTTKSRHIGVGLTIAKRFIAIAGGSISIIHDSGKGFTLEVAVPVSA